MALETEHLFTMTVHLKQALDITHTAEGWWQVFQIEQGQIEGTKINGKFLSSGSDWYLMRTDGVGEVDIRGTIRTEDGAYIYANFAGIIRFRQHILERFQNGDPVDASEYYFRFTPQFQTGSKHYSWLNHILTVGIGTWESVTSNWLKCDIYMVL